MRRYSILLVMLSLCTIQSTSSRHPAYAGSRIDAGGDRLTITIRTLDVNDTRLELFCEISNVSGHEVWICDDVSSGVTVDFETCLSEDGELVTLRRRLDVPSGGRVWSRRPLGRYVRMRAGERRHESWSASLPLTRAYVYGRPPRTLPAGLFHASRLAIEIGYYVGNLPQIILNRIDEAEKAYEGDEGSDSAVLEAFGDIGSFNFSREQMRNRDDEILIPYMYQRITGERLSRTVVDARIPCIGGQSRSNKKMREYRPLDLKACTRLEIRFTPSALEYSFPFAVTRGLFTEEEVAYLRSEHRFTVRDRNAIHSFAEPILRADSFGGMFRTDSRVHLDAYDGSTRLASFDVYADTVIETSGGQLLTHLPGAVDIETLVPELERLERRVQCAVNLRDLYHRLRLYTVLAASNNKGPGDGVASYPSPPNWFDLITSCAPGHHRSSLMKAFFQGRIKKAHVCPSVNEGESTYAMNPDCRADSAPDTVLLFETRPGWNLHGGPALFTFDNHEPRGGLVLLNNGTAKFIRTQEELKQLRWK